ncbi:FAD-linked oxidase [Nocardiopsis sp. TSRI0078]|uniref:FAD-binding oxidoreductase n=1 Tax=unclassified Nocardiopsis TaxID=2649073 RepID=UPI000939BCAB|nr:FAD-binding oxidoreductase [Nocardiopsis sp. TSRI0078]OKI22392.1 FAD-linked oxidase [Nocardiopsis sp. TSRI0078]
MAVINRRGFLVTGSAAAAGAGLTGSAASVDAAPASAAEDEAFVQVGPEDPRYLDYISGINQRWVAEPERVVLPRTTEAVVEAVQDAVDRGKRITVCSGGHCFEDFVFNSETEVIIHMALMDQVSFDEKRDAFEVGAGASLLQVYEDLFAGWGVTVPGGICYSVGAGGHIAGGGYGMLSRQYGLTVDHLHAVEVVVVDRSSRAESIIVGRDSTGSELDLFWAHTGGGGGSFGIVTRYWFRTPGAKGDPSDLLPRPPSEIFISTVSWPWEEVTRDGFASLVDFYGTWLRDNNEAGSTGGSLFSWLMLNHRSSGSIDVIVQLDAGLPRARAVLSDYLAGLNDAIGLGGGEVRRSGVTDSRYSTTQRLPWMRGTRYIGTVSPTQTDPNMRGKHKSAHMRAPMPADQIATIYRHLTEKEHSSRFAGAIFASAGGAISSVGPEETAVAQRDSIMKLNYESYWQDPSDDEANLAWVRGIYGDVYAGTGGVPVPGSVTDGCYVNYPDADLGDANHNTSSTPWYELYFKGNYDRLLRTKREWDPQDVFRHGQSIGS